MVMGAAVPFIGSWNTRATYAARRCTGMAVTSRPLMATEPESRRSAVRADHHREIAAGERQIKAVERNLLVRLAAMEQTPRRIYF